MTKTPKVGLLCPYPPEELHQGYYALNIIKNTHANFIKIGTTKSNAEYKINFKSLFLKEKLKKILKKEKINLLHIQYIPPFFGTRYLNLNLLRVYTLPTPIITTLHEVYFTPKKGIRNSILRFLEKNIVKRSKQIIVHNYMMADFLRKKYKTKKINTILLGHDIKKEHRRIGKNILFFGILSPGKGIEYLIKAMHYLRDCKLKIIGSIPNNICNDYKEKILKELRKSNLKNIEIKTKKWFPEKEKWQHYKKADIVILPYTWGPYNSAVIQDAIENALPVVVTRVGAIYGLIEKFNLGTIAKTKNPKSISQSINNVFNNYNKYKKNVRIFRKKTSWQNNGKTHLIIYKKALISI